MSFKEVMRISRSALMMHVPSMREAGSNIPEGASRYQGALPLLIVMSFINVCGFIAAPQATYLRVALLVSHSGAPCSATQSKPGECVCQGKDLQCAALFHWMQLDLLLA